MGCGLDLISKIFYSISRKIARKKLAALEFALGLESEDVEMKSDGWMMGNKVLFATLKTGALVFKIHWHPGNQEFFIEHESGGSSPLCLNIKSSVSREDGFTIR